MSPKKFLNGADIVMVEALPRNLKKYSKTYKKLS